MSEQLKYMGPWRDESLVWKTCCVLLSVHHGDVSVTSQVVVMTMRFFIYSTHLDSREHVVIATLLNGMKNVLSSMKEVPLSHPFRRTECRLGKTAFYPAYGCSPVLLSGLSGIDPNIYCNHSISFTFLFFNEIKM